MVKGLRYEKTKKKERKNMMKKKLIGFLKLKFQKNNIYIYINEKNNSEIQIILALLVQNIVK